MWARFLHLPHSITQPCLCRQWDTYAYSDDAQEQKRLQGLENRAQLSVENERNKVERLAKKKTNLAWSNGTLKKETREKRKENKVKKRQWLKSQQPQPSQPPSGSAIPQKRGLEADDEDEDDEDDWAELAREERVTKKVKKGGMAQLEFDAEFIP